MPITENDLSGVYDGEVLSASGEKIGSVGQIYLDDQSGEPTFVTANTGLFGMSQSFVPLRGARVENGNVIVDFDKTTVKDAPRIDDDGSLTPAEEDQLYAYYGMSTNTVDSGDYGTADQTPEPGYARTDADEVRSDRVPGDSGLGDRTDEVRSDRVPGDSGLGDRTDEVRSDRVPGDSGLGDRTDEVRSDRVPGDSGLGDRTDEVRSDRVPGDSGLGDRTDEVRSDRVSDDQPTGFTDRDDRPVDTGAGTDPRRGTDFGGPADGTKTTPDAPPVDRDQDALGRDENGDTAPPPSEAPPASSGGRLRKWVMTEYEPVKSEEVYVEGQGQVGEPPTR